MSVRLSSQRFAGKCIGKNFKGGFIARCKILNLSISFNDSEVNGEFGLRLCFALLNVSNNLSK